MYKYLPKGIPYLFLIPAFVFLAVFFFIPFFQTIQISFQDFSDIYNPNFVSFENYKALFAQKSFVSSILNTFWFMILCVPFLVIFPLFLAILINQKIRGVTLYKLLIYIPVVISIVVVAIAFKWLYAESGLLNYFLSLFNLPALGWLTDPRIAMISVALVTVFKGVGYYMMIYLSSLIGVPKDLYEQAQIDGAGEFQKHMTVTVPHLMPTIALVATISSISALKVFVEIYVMTRGGPMESTKTIVYYIYEHAFEKLDLGLASADAVVLLVLTLAFSLVNLYCFERKKYDLWSQAFWKDF